MRTKIESIARRAEKDIIKGYDIQARIEMAIKQALTQDLEPVAWMCKRDDGHFDVLTDYTCKKCFPVYTVPPHRTWVGLMQEEIDHIYTGIRAVHHDVDSDVLCRAIEAKLKEKNT